MSAPAAAEQRSATAVGQRSVTAVVLLTGEDAPAHHEETFRALREQTRRPDRVVVVAPTSLPDSAEEQLDRLFGSGEIDEILRTSRATAFADQVEEVLDLIAVRSAQADPEAGGTRPRRAGRRARVLDAEAEKRRLLREAESIAHVPERLRERSGAPGARGAGRRRATGGADSWLWFITEDAAPGRRSLEALLTAVHNAPTTAVAGAKRVRHRGGAAPTPERLLTADDAEGLVDVGITISHGGRIVSGVDAGEIDQGQADWRHDVLAVALPGMLVRQATLERIGGFDPAMPSPWAEIDLCHRVWRNAERVAVVAGARVVSTPIEEASPARVAEFRRGQILTLLKHRSMPMAIAYLLVLPLITLLRMAGAIAVHEPGNVLAELRGWAHAMTRAPAVMGRGMMAASRLPVPRRRLAPLYLPRGEDARQQLDLLWTRLFADDERTRRMKRTTWGIAGTSHGGQDADYGRHAVWTLIVVVASIILTLIALRPLLAAGDLVGPQLLPPPEDRAASGQAAWHSWVPGGLGARGPGDPLLALLGAIPASGSFIVAAVLFLGLPVSALGAWAAGGALTRSIGARLALSAAWGFAPPLLAALASGLWQMVLVHALLPPLALAIGRAIGLVNKTAQASVSAAAAAGLLTMVIAAVQPALLIIIALGVLLVVPAVPGRRRRLIWVLVPSLALLAPHLGALVAHPRALLGGGPGVPAEQAGGLTMLTLWPADSAAWQALAPFLGSSLAAALPVLVLLPFAVAALIAPTMAGAAGRAGRLGLLLAAAALLLGVISSQVPVGLNGTRVEVAPAHAALSIALLGVLLAAGTAFDGAVRAHETRSLPRVLTTSAAVVMAAVCAVLLAGWTIGLPAVLSVKRSTDAPVPAAAADIGRSSQQSRVLVLRGSGPERATASLVVQGGQTLIQRSAVADARRMEAALAGEGPDADAASAAFLRTTSELLSGSASAATADSLSALAIAYVYVPGDLEAQADLVRALDGSVLLQKVTTTSRGALWRATSPMPRAWVSAGERPTATGDVTPLASDGVVAEGRIEAAQGPRVLVLSERADSRWRATVNDEPLEPTTVDEWAQGFTVPPGAAGEVRVERADPWRLPSQILLGATVAVTVLIAVPWKRRGQRAEVYR